MNPGLREPVLIPASLLTTLDQPLSPQELPLKHLLSIYPSPIFTPLTEMLPNLPAILYIQLPHCNLLIKQFDQLTSLFQTLSTLLIQLLWPTLLLYLQPTPLPSCAHMNLLSHEPLLTSGSLLSCCQCLEYYFPSSLCCKFPFILQVSV